MYATNTEYGGADAKRSAGTQPPCAARAESRKADEYEDLRHSGDSVQRASLKYLGRGVRCSSWAWAKFTACGVSCRPDGDRHAAGYGRPRERCGGKGRGRGKEEEQGKGARGDGGDGENGGGAPQTSQLSCTRRPIRWAGFDGGGGVRGTIASWSNRTPACVVQSFGVANSDEMAAVPMHASSVSDDSGGSVVHNGRPASRPGVVPCLKNLVALLRQKRETEGNNKTGDSTSDYALHIHRTTPPDLQDWMSSVINTVHGALNSSAATGTQAWA
ncbi:hypothetical protein DFH06DRAFT_1149548 [Mycena polygramma]|nr:hypothetical protein DFH06DRAFT_1149548 [Mycena polygramma]